MPAVILVGMVAGGLIIVTFCIVCLLKKDVPIRGIGVAPDSRWTHDR